MSTSLKQAAQSCSHESIDDDGSPSATAAAAAIVTTKRGGRGSRNDVEISSHVWHRNGLQTKPVQRVFDLHLLPKLLGFSATLCTRHDMSALLVLATTFCV
jgi:hypothetical protein